MIFPKTLLYTNKGKYTWRQRRLAEMSYMMHCSGYSMAMGRLALSRRMIKSKVLSVPAMIGIETINNQDN
mgnify:CR=1 FL=1